LRLQHRILLAQLPALVAVLLLLLLGGRTVARLGAQGHEVMDANYRSVVAAQRMKESVERLDQAMLARVAGHPEGSDALLAEHRPRFEAELEVEEDNITEAGEAERVRELRAEWTRYLGLLEGFAAADPAEARRLYFDELAAAGDAVARRADRVLAVNQDAMARRNDEAAAVAEAARRSWLLWSLGGIALAVGLGVFVSHRLAVPLRVFAESAGAIGEGNLDVRLPRTGLAELDRLTEAFNHMGERLRLYRKAADSELTRAREAAQAAIESLTDPVLVLTVRGEVRASNGAARRTLDLDARSRRLDGADPALVEAIERVRAAVVADGRAVTPADFATVVVADGERAFLPHATPINDAVSGELVGVTVLLQEVTRLRRLDELKGNLVQTVAHELRTPLVSLGMGLHVALDERVTGPLAPTLVELLTTAREDVRRLRGIVEDLLDLSRIQHGRMVLHVEPGSAAMLLGGVRDAVASAAAAKHVTVEVDATGPAPSVAVDGPRMQLALVNLASNAVRHTPAGSTVRLGARGVEDAVRFEVDDEGAGVPPKDRDHIFEAFVRTGGGADEGGGDGVGLGLFIAREVARAHGGRIGVEDAPGGGARFWIEVPGGA
jgi:signal transduction histidine kinase